jgi:hypothetical protein
MVPLRMSRRMRLASSDWWALNSEMTALSSRDFRASCACWRATTDRQTATTAAAAAITAEMIARPMEPLSPTSMSSTPVGPEHTAELVDRSGGLRQRDGP